MLKSVMDLFSTIFETDESFKDLDRKKITADKRVVESEEDLREYTRESEQSVKAMKEAHERRMAKLAETKERQDELNKLLDDPNLSLADRKAYVDEYLSLTRVTCD